MVPFVLCQVPTLCSALKTMSDVEGTASQNPNEKTHNFALVIINTLKIGKTEKFGSKDQSLGQNLVSLESDLEKKTESEVEYLESPQVESQI